jgi:hypothetical protein
MIILLEKDSKREKTKKVTKVTKMGPDLKVPRENLY